MYAHRLESRPGRVRGEAPARDGHRAGCSSTTASRRPPTSIEWEELGELAGCRARPVLRIERIAEELGDLDAVRAEVAAARRTGSSALKTIAAYRGGLVDVRRRRSLAALEANEATGEPLPVQVHAASATPTCTSRAPTRATSSR